MLKKSNNCLLVSYASRYLYVHLISVISDIEWSVKKREKDKKSKANVKFNTVVVRYCRHIVEIVHNFFLLYILKRKTFSSESFSHFTCRLSLHSSSSSSSSTSSSLSSSVIVRLTYQEITTLASVSSSNVIIESFRKWIIIFLKNEVKKKCMRVEVEEWEKVFFHVFPHIRQIQNTLFVVKLVELLLV
jgi:hypothetical protein